VKFAISCLKNRRAADVDGRNAEMLKFLGNKAIRTFTQNLNEMINDKNFEFISKGILVPLPKSHKSKTVKIARPIILLKITRKIWSIIALNWMKPDVEQFPSPSKARFRRERSTIDIVWAEKLFGQ